MTEEKNRYELKDTQTTTRIIITTDTVDNAVLRLKELGIDIDPQLLKISKFGKN
jgi:hypothetical protein